MLYTSFPGIMPGERLLHTIEVHPIAEFAGYMIVGFAYILWLFLVFGVSMIFPGVSGIIQITGGLLSLGIGGYGLLWVLKYKRETVTFLTDVRLVMFKVMSPKRTVKEMLYWKDAQKASGVIPNFFCTLLNIGYVRVDSKTQPPTGWCIQFADEYTDIAAYINRILAIYRAHPEDIAHLSPYELLPKGRRGSV